MHDNDADGRTCQLPAADGDRRTSDFRALRAGQGVEAESHRLASCESRCSDGIRFHVVREGDHIVWRISGPPSARATLDAYYALPALVQTDDGAAALWATLADQRPREA
jgi:hypothetical protein